MSSSNAPEDLLHSLQTLKERDLVDRLRDMGIDKYIELPQIAVMGDTSSGKSSVLSALSGVTFPSNSKLTTRCPTQLTLSQAQTFQGKVHLRRFESNTCEHKDKLESMEDVPKAIEKLTRILVDEKQEISDDQIVIELEGPELPNLTLTDLPGLVRTVNDGEDASIIDRINAMVNRFMKQSRTIILAIVPANVDVHNTEILQAAQNADPEGTRTIAVVTKLDLVDKGAEDDVLELIQNKKKTMKLGYHAVRCRNQQELNDNISVGSGIEREKAFFANDQDWNRISKRDQGVPKLITKLVRILQDNIRRAMPDVKKQIDEKVRVAKDELERIGASLVNPSEQRQAYIRIVNRYTKAMEDAANGKYDTLPVSEDRPDVDLRLRARIEDFNQEFQAAIEASKSKLPMITVSPVSSKEPEEENDEKTQSVSVGDYVVIRDEDVWHSAKVARINKSRIQCRGSDAWIADENWKIHPRNELRLFIDKYRGKELSIFPSYSVFGNISHQWMKSWVEPSNELISAYIREIRKVSNYVASAVGGDSRVASFLQDQANRILDEVRVKTEEDVSDLQAREQDPYTQDHSLFMEFDRLRNEALKKQLTADLQPDIHGKVSLDAVKQWMHQQASSNDDREALEMQFAVCAYMKVASTRFIDAVPMCVDKSMVERFVKNLNGDLSSISDDQLKRVMAEESSTTEKRKEFKLELESLKEAKKCIEDFY